MVTEPVHIGLRKFNPATMRQSPVIRIIGKRATGKTTLAAHLAACVASLQTYVVDPMAWAHSSYISLPVVQYVRDISNGWFMALEQAQQLPAAGPVTVVVDNYELVYDKYKAATSDHDAFSGVLYAVNRHLNITTITCEQYPTSRPPIQRANTDYVFIMRESLPAIRKRLFDQHGGAFPTFSVFSQILDQATREPFECLVLDLTKHNSPLEEAVYWYRAPAPAE